MQTDTIKPRFDSSLVVFAEKTKEMLNAKRTVRRLYKSNCAPDQKRKAVEELVRLEDEVETLICDVLYSSPDPKRQVLNAKVIGLS